MDGKVIFERIKGETNKAVSRLFDKIEAVGKMGSLRLKINGLKGKVKLNKSQIGSIVFSNQERFKDYPEIELFIKKIKELEAEIDKIEEQISEIKDKMEDPEINEE